MHSIRCAVLYVCACEFDNAGKTGKRVFTSTAVLLSFQIARFSRTGKVEATRLYRGEYFQLPRVPVCSRVFTEGSLRAATFQLACVCLGVGIFAMPGIFASAGLGTGTAMVIGFGVAADFAIQCLLWGAEAASKSFGYCCRCSCDTLCVVTGSAAVPVSSFCLPSLLHSGAETAEDVLGAACGEFGRKLALLALALVCFMGNSAHVQFIAAQFMLLQGEGGGFVATIFGGDLRLQQAITGFLFGLLALPFCFKRSLAELRHVCMLPQYCDEGCQHPGDASSGTATCLYLLLWFVLVHVQICVSCGGLFCPVHNSGGCDHVYCGHGGPKRDSVQLGRHEAGSSR